MLIIRLISIAMSLLLNFKHINPSAHMSPLLACLTGISKPTSPKPVAPNVFPISVNANSIPPVGMPWSPLLRTVYFLVIAFQSTRLADLTDTRERSCLRVAVLCPLCPECSFPISTWLALLLASFKALLLCSLHAGSLTLITLFILQPRVPALPVLFSNSVFFHRNCHLFLYNLHIHFVYYLCFSTTMYHL